GLAHADVIVDRQGARLAVEAVDVAHQEIAALEFALIFVHHQAHVQPLLEEVLLARAQPLPDFLKLQQRRLAAQFADDVVVPLGDDEMPADRPATLRYDRAASRPLDQHADGALAQNAFAEDHAALIRPANAAGHATHHPEALVGVVRLLEK